jgi:hypothetical protein
VRFDVVAPRVASADKEPVALPVQGAPTP